MSQGHKIWKGLKINKWIYIIYKKNKVESLIESMKLDKISSDEKVNKLTQQIYFLTKDNSFKNLKSMGEVLEKSFNYLISNYENHEMLRINKVFWVLVTSKTVSLILKLKLIGGLVVLKLEKKNNTYKLQ